MSVTNSDLCFSHDCFECGGNKVIKMSENTAPQVGIFGWNELITSDVEAAKKFYCEMFGWEWETKTMAPGWDYTLFKKGETMVAGMFGITPEMGPIPPHWLSYVMSADIEADVEKAKAAGGSILKEATEVPNTGVFAIIRDPQGAVFALWKCSQNAKCD
ncbi:MAG: VOC family protein [Gloeobacteraceae cyanobacterium ES-bin-144]|nr:VOC family protein [Verrucomicrobiales bacterium]